MRDRSAAIVNSNFNYWCSHKRLAHVAEIYAGESRKAYNNLKTIITDQLITVNAKYLADYDIENWMHIFACSNVLRALKLSDEDRRFFTPRVTEEKKPPAWWDEFYEWLDFCGGYGIIKQWACDFLETHSPVSESEPAPWSEAKGDVIREGYSPGQMRVVRALNTIITIRARAIEHDELKNNGGEIPPERKRLSPLYGLSTPERLSS